MEEKERTSSGTADAERSTEHICTGSTAQDSVGLESAPSRGGEWLKRRLEGKAVAGVLCRELP